MFQRRDSEEEESKEGIHHIQYSKPDRDRGESKEQTAIQPTGKTASKAAGVRKHLSIENLNMNCFNHQHDRLD